MSSTAAVDTYLSALRACSLLPAPAGSCAFVILTTLARPYELIHPSSSVSDGVLRIEACSRASATSIEADRPLTREIPLAAIALSTLAGDSGTLPELLCVPHDQVAHFLTDVAAEIESCGAGEPGLGRHFTLAGLVTLALRAILQISPFPHQRAAALAYAGITPVRSCAEGEAQQVGSGELVAVADIVDLLAAEAGYRVEPCADRSGSLELVAASSVVPVG